MKKVKIIFFSNFFSLLCREGYSEHFFLLQLFSYVARLAVRAVCQKIPPVTSALVKNSDVAGLRKILHNIISHKFSILRKNNRMENWQAPSDSSCSELFYIKNKIYKQFLPNDFRRNDFSIKLNAPLSQKLRPTASVSIIYRILQIENIPWTFCEPLSIDYYFFLSHSLVSIQHEYKVKIHAKIETLKKRFRNIKFFRNFSFQKVTVHYDRPTESLNDVKLWQSNCAE